MIKGLWLVKQRTFAILIYYSISISYWVVIYETLYRLKVHLLIFTNHCSFNKEAVVGGTAYFCNHFNNTLLPIVIRWSAMNSVQSCTLFTNHRSFDKGAVVSETACYCSHVAIHTLLAIVIEWSAMKLYRVLKYFC